MKALWRRLFGRKDELDDATTAYIEGRASPAEVDAVRRELDVSPERGREIEELRQTVDLMRSVETSPAPRSFALTPDMVPDQRMPLRLDLSYAPAAAAAVLVLAVGVLIAGDLADLLKQSESGGTESMSASPQFAVSERVVQGQSVQPEAGKTVAEQAEGQKAVVVEKPVTHTEKVVETVVVEKQVTAVEKVVETVVVEKPVTRTEKVVETVTVEKHTEKVVETVVVEKAVEKQVTRTEKVVETVVVEKPVTVTEKIVETPALTAMRVVQESDEATAKEETPADGTPVSEVAVAAKSKADEAEQASPTPAAASATLATSVPTVEPTTQPTATLVPTVEPTPQPTATPVPTIEPTTQPTATPVPTIEPTTQPTSTPVPTIEPTPRPIPSPILQEDEATRVVAEQDDHRGVKLPLSGISLPLWQLEVLFAVLAGLMVALWAVLRQRSGRRN